MFIACMVVVAVFIIFIASTYLVTRKSYSFEANGNIIKVSNAGSNLKVFVGEKLYSTFHMPQLIRGEVFKVEFDNKEVLIKCKTNSFGTKFSLKAFMDDKEIYNNGVVIKNK